MTHCPVCDGVMNEWLNTEGGVVTEDGVSCDHCGYRREFAFGAYRIIVNGKEFMWNSATPHEEIRKLKKESNQELENARAALYSV